MAGAGHVMTAAAATATAAGVPHVVSRSPALPRLLIPAVLATIPTGSVTLGQNDNPRDTFIV